MVSTIRRAVRAATPALALGTAALTAVLAACSDSPTGPSASASPAAARALPSAPTHSTSPTATSGGAPAPAMLTSWFSLSQAQLDALMADLAAFQAAVVPIPTAGSVSSPAPMDNAGSSPTRSAAGAALVCRAEHGWSATQTIGASGGTLHIGPHQFTVPAGALDHDVTITATSTGSTRRGLDFAPHGLHFQKPVSMTISFAGCEVPTGGTLGVVYTDSNGRPIQRMPAHADHPAHRITALTDHFSGYIASWGRN